MWGCGYAGVRGCVGVGIWGLVDMEGEIVIYTLAR